MKENKQIERAALLSDIEPAEELDTGRATAFVNLVIKPVQPLAGAQTPRLFNRHRTFIIGASTVLAAAVVVMAFIVVNPASEEFGSPAVLSEQSYTHSAMAEVDSSSTVSSDSVVLSVKEIK